MIRVKDKYLQFTVVNDRPMTVCLKSKSLLSNDPPE